MALVISRERLHGCSELLRESMEANSVTLEQSPESAVMLGRYVMSRVLPELNYMFSTQLGVAAEAVIQEHDGERKPMMSAEFIGNLSHIRISKVVVEQPEGLVAPKPDILLIFTQKISEPDPVDLGYSDEILVPMSEMDSLRLAP